MKRVQRFQPITYQERTVPSDSSQKPLHSQVFTLREEEKSQNPGNHFTLQTHSGSDSLVSTANFKSVELVTLTQGDMKHHVQKLTTKEGKITYVIPYHGDGGTNDQQREAEHLKLRAIIAELAAKESGGNCEIVIPCEANISPFTKDDKGKRIPNPGSPH